MYILCIVSSCCFIARLELHGCVETDVLQELPSETSSVEGKVVDV